MSLTIPDELATRANSFPESSYGATTVSLILSSGRRIDDVVLGGASEIVKVGGRRVSDASELDFRVSEIIDVIPDGGWKAVRAWLAAVRRAWNRR